MTGMHAMQKKKYYKEEVLSKFLHEAADFESLGHRVKILFFSLALGTGLARQRMAVHPTPSSNHHKSLSSQNCKIVKLKVN